MPIPLSKWVYLWPLAKNQAKPTFQPSARRTKPIPPTGNTSSRQAGQQISNNSTRPLTPALGGGAGRLHLPDHGRGNAGPDAMAGDGHSHSYERAAIERWLAAKSTSPMTGAALEHICLFSHHILRRQIREWRSAGGRTLPFTAPLDLNPHQRRAGNQAPCV